MVSLVYDDFIVTNSEFRLLFWNVPWLNSINLNTTSYLKWGFSYIKVSSDDYPKITAELQNKGLGTFSSPYEFLFS